MLILSRRIGESIIIGEDIDVTVLETRGNQVRVGSSAPKDAAHPVQGMVKPDLLTPLPRVPRLVRESWCLSRISAHLDPTSHDD